MTTTTQILLPGDTIPTSSLPKPSTTSNTSKPKPLTLGPHLLYTPPSTLHPTTPGLLQSDPRKNALWLEPTSSTSRYLPSLNDLVIATVHHSSTDTYHCLLTPYTSPATLPQLAFEGATKKTRPQLVPGSIVYARLSSVSKHMDPEIECVHPSTGKSEGLGELKGGMVFDVSIGLCRRLMMVKAREEGGVAVLEEMAEKFGARFEVAVGRNGRVWVRGESVKITVAVGRALAMVDEGNLGVDEQVKLVKQIMKGV